MEKNRAIGAAKGAKDEVTEAAGIAAGDVKLKTKGKTDEIDGKVQNALGTMKDTLRRV